MARILETTIVLLVLLSSMLHAAWNFVSRRVKGNLVVLWLSVMFAGILILPVVVVLAIENSAVHLSVPHAIATAVIHAFYFSLLGLAYETGDISVVYPVARGTGVAGTAVLAIIFAIDGITWSGIAGIAIICIGLILLKERASAGKKQFLIALLVGVTIMGYSIVDKLGVSRSHPLPYICALFLGSSICMTPYVIARYRGRIKELFRPNVRYMLFIGPAAMATYLMILFAFQKGAVSIIVAFRESAVVFGSILGYVILKEPYSARKAAALAVVVAGLVTVNLSG